MGRILVGISSWADPELAQSGYYPADVKTPDARLRYYAAQFPLAEIDSSYHFFPTQRNLKLWMENTPEGFVFDIKAFSLFTRHPTPVMSLPKTIREKYGGQVQGRSTVYLQHLSEACIDELWGIFSSTVDSLKAKGKLGLVLFQFPPWFHPEPGNYDYIAGCRERLTGYMAAVEFRAGSWLIEHRKETLAFLRKHALSLVCVDEPQGFKSSVPPVAEVTSPIAVIRFHGQNRENWERKGVSSTDRFSYLYTEDELKAWAPGILRMAKKASEVHVIFKNKHADFPIRNAAQMKELLGIT